MVTISEVSYRKSIIENSDSEMDVNMELDLDGESMVVVKSPKAAMVGKLVKPAKRPMAGSKTNPKKKDGVKKDAMKAKAKPKANAVQTPTKGMDTAEMVAEALASLKSHKGITLASIRNYLYKKYDAHGKRRDNLIKDTLKELFATGELGNLEPSQDGDLKFNNRFWYTPNK